MTTLKPCPFCGGTPTILVCARQYDFIPTVVCECGAAVTGERDQPKECAVRLWNTRAMPEVTPEMVEAAQSAMIAFSHAAALAAEPLDVSGCMRAALTAALKEMQK